MKLTRYRILAVSASLCLFPLTLSAQSTVGAGQQPASAQAPEQSVPSTARSQAMNMVRGRATLLDTLDAKNLHPGAMFQAKLDKTVHLTNGPELPSGTILEGTVAADDMNVSGNSKLVIRFTNAQLKDGQSVPIKATVVGLFKPGNEPTDYSGNPVFPPNSWKAGTLAVDQLNVAKGVDLHSKIASRNSGVFVTTTNDDVKLPKGSDINLALAAEQPNQQNASTSMSPNGSGM